MPANPRANAVDESLATLLGKTRPLIYSFEQAIFPPASTFLSGEKVNSAHGLALIYAPEQAIFPQSPHLPIRREGRFRTCPGTYLCN